MATDRGHEWHGSYLMPLLTLLEKRVMPSVVDAFLHDLLGYIPRVGTSMSQFVLQFAVERTPAEVSSAWQRASGQLAWATSRSRLADVLAEDDLWHSVDRHLVAAWLASHATKKQAVRFAQLAEYPDYAARCDGLTPVDWLDSIMLPLTHLISRPKYLQAWHAVETEQAAGLDASVWIREWAQNCDVAIKARGRVPRAVAQQYEAAVGSVAMTM